MKIVSLTTVALAVSFLAISKPVLAHHGRVEYENRSVTLRGTVTKFEWSNPHVVISFAVKDDKGNEREWYAEVLPPSQMSRAGWTSQSIKPGDQVTLIGRPGKKGEHILWLEYLVTPDGQKLGRERETP